MKKTITTKRGAPTLASTVKSTPNAPHTFSRRILLAVTGLSPQVVTETVYALAMTVTPAFVPTEVHLLTTAEGAERADLTLLSDDLGWFHRLRKDYGLPEIQFDQSTIVGLKSPDIRTRKENESLADALTNTIRKMTSDPDCALHVSIAGGRKTMGFYAGYALSLFGRPQDRLSHVLVSEPYEFNTDFFYPTPYSRVIYAKDRKPLDTRNAKVDLAEIPFVRLRPDDDRLLKGKVTFSEAVAAAQRALNPTRLAIDLDRKRIHAGDSEVHLPPASLAFLSWLARRTDSGAPDVACPSDGAPESEYARGYLAEYRHVSDDVKEGTLKRLKNGMDKAFFEQAVSKLSRHLQAALGPEGSQYGVADNGARPKLYRIAVPRGNIRWLGDF